MVKFIGSDYASEFGVTYGYFHVLRSTAPEEEKNEWPKSMMSKKYFNAFLKRRSEKHHKEAHPKKVADKETIHKKPKVADKVTESKVADVTQPSPEQAVSENIVVYNTNEAIRYADISYSNFYEYRKKLGINPTRLGYQRVFTQQQVDAIKESVESKKKSKKTKGRAKKDGDGEVRVDNVDGGGDGLPERADPDVETYQVMRARGHMKSKLTDAQIPYKIDFSDIRRHIKKYRLFLSFYRNGNDNKHANILLMYELLHNVGFDGTDAQNVYDILDILSKPGNGVVDLHAEFLEKSIETHEKYGDMIFSKFLLEYKRMCDGCKGYDDGKNYEMLRKARIVARSAEP